MNFQSDKHWNNVLALARKYGFILKADKNNAILATHETQYKKYGADGYKKIQDMNKRK